MLRLCSGVPRGLGNEQVGSARWVRNPKFCPCVISCRRQADSVACRGNYFLGWSGLGFLRLLRPSCSRCLLGSLGSLRSCHALCGIGTTLLSATHGAIFNNYKLSIGMNRAMFSHTSHTLPLLSMRLQQIGFIGAPLQADAGETPHFGLSHHDLNLQSVECFTNVVVAFLDDSSEVWPLNPGVCFRIPDSA